MTDRAPGPWNPHHAPILLLIMLAAFALPWPATAKAQYLTADDLVGMEGPAPDRTVSYAEDPEQFGHLRLPEGPGPHPVVVIVHGGCWLSFADLQHTGPMAADLTDHGVATWSLEYRRIDSPGGGWPNTFLDVGRGVDYLRELAVEHPLDLDRVVAVGHSAGGHLALWAAGRRRISPDSALHVPDPLPIHGVVSLAGPGELATFRDRDERVCGIDVIDRLMGGSPEEVPGRYAAGSPVRLLPLGVSQRLLTGEHDPAVPPRFATAYAANAREAGDDAGAMVLEDASHFEPVVPSTAAWPEVRSTILGLLPSLTPAAATTPGEESPTPGSRGPIGETALRLSEPVIHLADVAVREPMVVEHPTGTLFVAGYTQEIEETGRPPKLFRSDDGGSIWERVDVGAPEEGAVGNSDVDLAIASDGTLYFLTMGFDRTTREGTHVAVGVSRNVGQSWEWTTLPGSSPSRAQSVTPPASIFRSSSSRTATSVSSSRSRTPRPTAWDSPGTECELPLIRWRRLPLQERIAWVSRPTSISSSAPGRSITAAGLAGWLPARRAARTDAVAELTRSG